MNNGIFVFLLFHSLFFFLWINFLSTCIKYVYVEEIVKEIFKIFVNKSSRELVIKKN